MAKDAFYFPHDTNASSDPKMMLLLSTCGVAGVGMFWVIVEILHQQEDGRISYEAFKNYVKLYIGFQNSQGQHMFNTIEQGLIESGLLVKDGEHVHSGRVLRNKAKRDLVANLRSMAGKKSAEVRLNTTTSNTCSTHVNTCSTPVNTCSTLKRKGKERKGNEIKENLSVETDMEKRFDEVWQLYPKRVGRKEALRHFKATVKNQEDLESIKTAVGNYKNSKIVRDWEEDGRFVKNGSSFFNNWKDFLEVQGSDVQSMVDKYKQEVYDANQRATANCA